MASLLNAFLAGSQGGEQARERADERERRSSLASLMSQAYTQPDQARSLLPQIAAVDADAGMGAYKAFQQMDEDRRKQFGQYASVFAALPDAQKAAAYPQFAAQAKQVLGLPVPDQWDPEFAPRISQIAQALTDGAQGTPSGVQEFNYLTQGLGSDDVMKARRIQLGLDPRAVTGAIKFDTFSGADGRPRPQRNNPSTGGIEIFYDETGQWVPLGAAQPATGSPAQMGRPIADPRQVQAQFASLSQSFPGTQITSTTRTPERNRQVGGVPNSQHLSGTAGDFVVPPAQRPAFIQQARSMGYEAIDEGDHVHLELPPGAPRVSGLGVGRRPEDEAAAVEAAKQGVQTGFMPEKERIKTQAEIERAVAAAAAKGREEARLEAIQALPRVVQESTNTIGLIDKALNHPGRSTATGASGRMDPRNYLPGTDATDFRVLLDQIKGGTFLQAFQSLKGGGAITQVEGTKAEQAIARLDTAQSDAEFEQALRDLRQIAENALTRAQDRVAQFGGAQQPAPSAGGWAIKALD